MVTFKYSIWVIMINMVMIIGRNLKENEELLNVIPFSSDRSKINEYWSKVGANCITGIYEPFGYTMCETLDRRVPAIVQDIDGPSEIID